jgi:predicted protein tyrosine phosphatase
MVKIVTACKQGLVRSVGLADVLKMHFEPVDVIPVGLNSNSKETLEMLGQWCDWFVVMEQRYLKRVPAGVPKEKLLVCEVGQDTYGNSHNPVLIDMVWRWTRLNQRKMGINEHTKRI